MSCLITMLMSPRCRSVFYCCYSCIYLICDEIDENKFYESLMSSVVQKYDLDRLHVTNRADFTCDSEWVNFPSTRVPDL